MGQEHDARKAPYGREEALALARRARRLVVAKGKQVVVVNPKQLEDDEIAGLLLGPTGNLRAPTLRKGQSLLTGFHEDAYAKEFG